MNEKKDMVAPIMAQSYLHTHAAGAFVPLVQSSITGALAMLLVGAGVIKFRVADGWFWVLIAWVSITTVAWLVLQRHWFALTMVGLEAVIDTGNGDDVIGFEQTARHKIIVDVKDTKDGRYEMQSAYLPVSEDEMIELACALLRGQSFSEKGWTGTGKMFSVDQFRNMRIEMLKRGILAPASSKDARQGYVLTRAGRAVMEHFAALKKDDEI